MLMLLFMFQMFFQTLGDLNFKGHVGVKTSSGSRMRDPRFEIMRVEVMSTDRDLCFICLFILLFCLIVCCVYSMCLLYVFVDCYF